MFNPVERLVSLSAAQWDMANGIGNVLLSSMEDLLRLNIEMSKRQLSWVEKAANTQDGQFNLSATGQDKAVLDAISAYPTAVYEVIGQAQREIMQILECNFQDLSQQMSAISNEVACNQSPLWQSVQQGVKSTAEASSQVARNVAEASEAVSSGLQERDRASTDKAVSPAVRTKSVNPTPTRKLATKTSPRLNH